VAVECMTMERPSMAGGRGPSISTNAASLP